LERECRTIGFCEVGSAVLTKGYNLATQHVIHTVGPLYGQENGRESLLLTQCYESSLELAEQTGSGSLAFPSISTGIHAFPVNEAAAIAADVFASYQVKKTKHLRQIIMVAYNQLDYETYSDAFRAAGVQLSGRVVPRGAIMATPVIGS